jgi:hypothetical protein
MKKKMSSNMSVSAYMPNQSHKCEQKLLEGTEG